MSASPDRDWADRLQQRLRLREARYQRGDRWVVEDRPGLMFLHVSKSGGTSLDAFFANFFRPEEMLPTELQVRRMVEWDDADWGRYRYFKLEWPFELTARKSPPLHFVTLLRDPGQRTISLYKHLRREADHTERYDSVRARRTPELEAARRLSLAEWVRLSPPEPGAYFRHPYLGMATIGVRNLVDKSEAELDALLERAKANLREGFAFVGIVEDYLRSKRLFCRTFGLPLHYAVGEERLNTAPEGGDSKSLADPETMALIRTQNRWDMALYEYARTLLTERHRALEASAGQGPESEGAYLPEQTPRPGRGCLEQSIETLSGSGFYPLEQSPVGPVIRWTGALHVATLDLIAAWPAAGTVEIHLDILAVVQPERLGELQLLLDGAAPRSTRWEPIPHGTRLVAQFTLNSDIARRGLHQLQIHGPLAAPPAEPGLPPDRRRLGIGLQLVACLWGGATRFTTPLDPAIRAA